MNTTDNTTKNNNNRRCTAPHEMRVRVTDEQYTRLEKLRAITGDTCATLVRRAIVQFLTQQGV